MVFPSKAKVRPVKHFAALPYTEIAPFMQRLRAKDGIGSRAIQFTILTGCRSGMVRLMRWSHVDLETSMWTVTKELMKGRREYTSPLSAAALGVLRSMEFMRHDDSLVFPGRVRGKPMSDMSLSSVLKRMASNDITVHGFRSTFRDWARDVSPHPRDAAEIQIAHIVGDKTEQAYARGEMLKIRRQMMDDWAAYVLPDHRPELRVVA
jgi:integrase